MSILIANMTARPEKQRELLLTLHELTEAMRQEPGFLEAQIGINPDNQNQVKFIETWASQQALDAYMQQSRYFQVLRGAIKVLTSAAQIEFNTNGGPAHVRNHN